MSNRVQVYKSDGSRIILTQADHVATGGEGSVYLKGTSAYKVYTDPAKAIALKMEQRFALLSQIKHPQIAAPRAVLLDKDGNLLGLELPRVSGEALCKAFTNTWRDTHQFGLPETAKTVESMREVVNVAHQHHALMVDGNELNWLLEGVIPTAIDVDSWQLPGFPATAIMPSIRDYHAKQFSEATDWFAWSIITFNLWTGIHPFKGTHPDFARGALEPRMRACASVFDSRVKVPGAMRPMSAIPKPLLDWYEGMFSTATRCAPPSLTASAVMAQTAPKLRVRQTLQGNLRLERLGSAGSRIQAAFNGFVIARSGLATVLWDTLAKQPIGNPPAELLASVVRRQGAVIRTAFGRVALSLDERTQLITAQDLDTGAAAQLPSIGHGLWQSGNRVFAVVDGVAHGLVELAVSKLNGKFLLSTSAQWPANALSCQFFRGCFTQDCMDAVFLGVLDGQGLVQAPAPGLAGYRIQDGIAAGAHQVWLSGVRAADGQTVRLRLAFNVNRFEVSEEVVVDSAELDGAATLQGVLVLRDGQGLIAAKGVNLRTVADSGLSESARLFSLGAGVGVFEDGEVMQLSMT